MPGLGGGIGVIAGLAAALSAVVIACSDDASADPVAARRHLEAGALLHLQGRFSEAIAEYDLSIALFEGDQDAYFNRGLAEAGLRQFETAISDFDAAIRLLPAFAEAHYQRANAYDDLGQHERALADYDSAIEFAAPDARLTLVQRDRAIAQFKLNRQRQASNGGTDPMANNPKGYLERCTYYTRQGLTGRALEDCDAAVRLDPEDSRAFFARANAYVQAGEFRRAILDYDQAALLGYSGPHLYFNRGVSNAQVGRQVEAIQDFNRTLRLDPAYASAYGERAASLAVLGRYEAAERDVQRAVERGLDPNDLAEEIDGIRRLRERRMRDEAAR
ncbi:MAG: tetratricopeptide repeat protein [Chloroflexi bacterium]|nr:tetratricopeptide repeat protein [Chloroflexota bacterium]